MRSAGVVAEHAAKSAVVVCCRIGSPGKCVGFGSAPQGITYRTRLHACVSFFWIQFQNMMQVLAPIQHNRDIAALAGQAGSTAAREKWYAEPAARRHSLLHIRPGSWDHNPDWHLTVV